MPPAHIARTCARAPSARQTAPFDRLPEISNRIHPLLLLSQSLWLKIYYVQYVICERGNYVNNCFGRLAVTQGDAHTRSGGSAALLLLELAEIQLLALLFGLGHPTELIVARLLDLIGLLNLRWTGD